ncbi:acylphosphatase [Melioribacter roseus P3M-2]|jgi:acylphosphatase|uniref:Acylphosphatase n=1 Tax=Melioribacter roseus (strain DSM 23840 / JCM 17771 / VKM B-2668 / P3M-2) TaxID=1191523 RepID=I7A543_MELRP|nr:acylphosphatase [Melioribacter roseus]AFN74996.1 acylphosphatase [Melioribacter roseus P3M-2]
MKRAEIIVNGLVQGVGFRYYVLRHAQKLGLKGYVKNLFSGEVLTVVEGEEYKIEELFNLIKIGPPMSDVKNAFIKWFEPKNEFTKFEIRY